MALLAPHLGPPPCPRRLLRLTVVEHRDPIGILEVVCGANLTFCIATSFGPPPSQPRPPFPASAVPERETLFQTPPIGLGTDQQPQPSGAFFEVRIAHRPSHLASQNCWGVFGEYPWANNNVPQWTENARITHNIYVRGHSLMSTKVPVLTLSRRKQGFESPRERQ